MNPAAFYGEKTLRTRLPPEDKSDDSCLSDSDKDDPDYNPPTQGVSLMASESSSDEDDECDTVAAQAAHITTTKQSVKWTKTNCQEEHQIPSWNGSLPQSESV